MGKGGFPQNVMQVHLSLQLYVANMLNHQGLSVKCRDYNSSLNNTTKTMLAGGEYGCPLLAAMKHYGGFHQQIVIAARLSIGCQS